MSEIVLKFDYVKDADKLLQTIKNDWYDKFEWSWTESDRKENWLNLLRLLSDFYYNDEPPVFISYSTLNWDDYSFSCGWIGEDWSYVEVEGDIENMFDFTNPLDIIYLLDDLAETVHKAKNEEKC